MSVIQAFIIQPIVGFLFLYAVVKVIMLVVGLVL